MARLITARTEITEGTLNALAHIPTTSLSALVEPEFFAKLSDDDYMRIAFYLAKKGYDEGGCPIGAVIKDNESGLIVGKGHNTLVQEDHPYNHGETSAVRDAKRKDFGKTTLYTSLSPCDVCTALIVKLEFARIVVGDVTNTDSAPRNLGLLRGEDIRVDVAEDPKAVALYARYRKEHPELDVEDWKGLARVRKMGIK